MHSTLTVMPRGPSRRTLLGALSGLAAWGPSSLAQSADQTPEAALPPLPAGPPALLLASLWPSGSDPSDYLVSEKYDGVRAYWDGTHLRLRGGGRVHAPASWLAQLPAEQHLDGELWLGRGRFDETSATVRRNQPDGQAWQTMRYMVFELPQASGSFAARFERMNMLAARLSAPFLQVVEQRRVANAAALDIWLANVVADGGEGLALHRADAPYLTGRSPVLAKYKPVNDAEATVLGYQAGQGRLTGKVGALRVRNDEGLEFSIGTGLSDALRQNPPPVGSRITYAWRGETPSGLPRFVSFLRQRPDGV